MCCPMHGSLVSLCLNKFGTAEVVIPCACFALFKELFRSHINEVGIFSVKIDFRTKLLCSEQKPYNCCVINHHMFLFIYKEALEACNTFFYGCFHFIKDFTAVKIGDTAMKGIVNTGLFFKNLFL